MSTEIPEIFRALLEHPFTLPSFDENGKWLIIGIGMRCAPCCMVNANVSMNRVARVERKLLRNPSHMSRVNAFPRKVTNERPNRVFTELASNN